MPIGQMIMATWQFLICQHGGRPPSYFLQSEILSADAVQMSNMRHRATYRANWSNCYGDMVVFDLRWWPSAILDFFKFQNLSLTF